jgi:hypothetical protein
MPKSIFVSHISEEREIAALIKRAMTEAFGPVAVFTSSDVGSVGAGENWLNAIKKALARSAAIIVLCSQESIVRPWVQFELGAAWMLKKRIIPICHSGLRTEHLSIPLSLFEAVELGTESGLRKLYGGVVKALKVKAERVPADMQELLRETRALQRDLGVHQFEMYIDILIPRDDQRAAPGATSSAPPTSAPIRAGWTSCTNVFAGPVGTNISTPCRLSTTQGVADPSSRSWRRCSCSRTARAVSTCISWRRWSRRSWR